MVANNMNFSEEGHGIYFVHLWWGWEWIHKGSGGAMIGLGDRLKIWQDHRRL
jgi:hypothetical protein